MKNGLLALIIAITGFGLSLNVSAGLSKVAREIHDLNNTIRKVNHLAPLENE